MNPSLALRVGLPLLCVALGATYILVSGVGDRGSRDRTPHQAVAEVSSEVQDLDTLEGELKHLRRQVNRLSKEQQDDSLSRPGKVEQEDAGKGQDDNAALSFEDRQAIAFEKEQEMADRLLTKAMYSEPADRSRGQALSTKVSGQLKEVGANLSEVTCSEKLCQSTIEYPEGSDPQVLQSLALKEMCPGGCWIRRLADREKWEVYSAREGEELPEMGAIPTQ